jgi:rfaE bifunctional protein nucleotidyltransferase chain/domain
LGEIISQDNLILQRQKWKGNGQRVVLVAGRFDLLHPGHIRVLEQARSHGDILVVAVQSDASVRAQKARLSSSTAFSSCPVTPAGERGEILAALAAVDYVVAFDEPSPGGLIVRLLPDIVAQGASAEAVDSPENRAAAAAGAKLVWIPLEPGYSTAWLIERIAQPRV